jgi:hypothetical protein
MLTIFGMVQLRRSCGVSKRFKRAARPLSFARHSPFITPQRWWTCLLLTACLHGEVRPGQTQWRTTLTPCWHLRKASAAQDLAQVAMQHRLCVSKQQYSCVVVLAAAEQSAPPRTAGYGSNTAFPRSTLPRSTQIPHADKKQAQLAAGYQEAFTGLRVRSPSAQCAVASSALMPLLRRWPTQWCPAS